MSKRRRSRITSIMKKKPTEPVGDTIVSSYFLNRDNDKPYLIERREKRITYGVPGSIEMWRPWAAFEDAETRDKELELLNSIFVDQSFRAKNKNGFPWWLAHNPHLKSFF